MSRCFPTAHAVGFYDYNNAFFYLEDATGNDYPAYPDCAVGRDRYVVRWTSHRRGRVSYRETVVTAEEAWNIAARFRRQRVFHRYNPNRDFFYTWTFNPSCAYVAPRYYGEQIFRRW